MGLIKEITKAITDKAKEEVLLYIKKAVDADAKKKAEAAAPAITEESKPAETPAPAPEKQADTKPEEQDETVLRINDDKAVRLTFTTRADSIVISRDLAGMLQMLSYEEFALYLKLYFFSFSQKKNYGYVGNSLRRSIGLDEMTPKQFGKLINMLGDRGLLEVLQVSDTQSTFTLFVPFDETCMKKVEEKPRPDKKPLPPKKETKPQVQEEIKSEPKLPERMESGGGTPPGRAGMEMDEDQLVKSYRTFISLEIDKAKMRVGRSNFDKIYMEAVKYIDKKYGFKVLSDSEKFKEYLTQYYISAFDIPSYEQWRKTKV